VQRSKRTALCPRGFLDAPAVSVKANTLTVEGGAQICARRPAVTSVVEARRAARRETKKIEDWTSRPPNRSSSDDALQRSVPSIANNTFFRPVSSDLDRIDGVPHS